MKAQVYSEVATITKYFFEIWCVSMLLSFQAGDTKLEIFLPKNQHTQRNFENFENLKKKEGFPTLRFGTLEYWSKRLTQDFFVLNQKIKIY